jgi:archaellum biogenesis ATPase FlaH
MQGEVAEMSLEWIETNEDKVNLKEYDESWLAKNVKAWIEFKNLDSSVLDLLTYMKTSTVTIENVGEIVEKAKEIINTRNNITFDFDEGLDFFNADSHKQPTLDTFSTGFQYLDTVLGGGWTSKALYVIAGQNKAGKCHIGSTKIKIRNKKTGEIMEMPIMEFMKKVKKQ